MILATYENISQRVMFLDGTSLPQNHQNYNANRITNLGQPVEPDDAATKRFVGNILRKRTFYVNPEGAQANLKMNNHTISRLANPTRPIDAAHKFYVDSLFENLQNAVDDHITQYQREMEALHTRD